MSDRGSASLHGNMVHLLPPTPVKIFRFAPLNPCRKQGIGNNLVQATSRTGFSKTNFWGARLSCPALCCSLSIKIVAPQSKCCSTHLHKIPFSLDDMLNKCWLNNTNPKSTSPAGIRNSLRDLICSFSKFTLLWGCFMYCLYRRSPKSTLLKPRTCSETQFSKKYLLQPTWSFMGDTLAYFSTDGHTQEVRIGCMHKAHRWGSKSIYTKKTDTM